MMSCGPEKIRGNSGNYHVWGSNGNITSYNSSCGIKHGHDLKARSGFSGKG